jgi:hypothetical protein
MNIAQNRPTVSFEAKSKIIIWSNGAKLIADFGLRIAD